MTTSSQPQKHMYDWLPPPLAFSESPSASKLNALATELSLPAQAQIKSYQSIYCAMCTKPYVYNSTQNGEYAFSLPCGHIFGENCVRLRAENGDKEAYCPTCEVGPYRWVVFNPHIPPHGIYFGAHDIYLDIFPQFKLSTLSYEYDLEFWDPCHMSGNSGGVAVIAHIQPAMPASGIIRAIVFCSVHLDRVKEGRRTLEQTLEEAYVEVEKRLAWRLKTEKDKGGWTVLFEEVTKQESELKEDLLTRGHFLAYAVMVLLLTADRLSLRAQDRWTLAQYLLMKEERHWVKLGRKDMIEQIRACVPATWGALCEIWEGVEMEIDFERSVRADLNMGMRL